MTCGSGVDSYVSSQRKKNCYLSVEVVHFGKHRLLQRLLVVNQPLWNGTKLIAGFIESGESGFRANPAVIFHSTSPVRTWSYSHCIYLFHFKKDYLKVNDRGGISK